MNPQLACVVEGHGDREAAPIIIRRIAAQLDPPTTVHVLHPIRIPKTKLLKVGELERAVELAARQIAGDGAILILIDGDDDCPAQLGPALLQRAMAARKDVPLAAVIAKREFEAWFLAAAESLRGNRGLTTTLVSPLEPEAIRGAKEWLTAHMKNNLRYVETLDQPALAARFDLEVARRADSFDKFYREVVRLLTFLRG